ncbi:helix-turn-helix domain-containing protein [Natronosporangium hydrolyticum]|uniref:Helix-turn-helix domain-containing protein n=1 Tax=Natronosporangium hydrolyticum TaxID=2811111 RepID=A0A895YKW0_9ACTN|nr:helix-turn-helix transcriptional regulator [Natronosporangium hydrolyticum]QSB15933.1 helix-turn-helix domain-containing protein [Natronosporangium hydrolyticum]
MVRGELGAFLRSRREAVTPAQVGLPANPGRRTPGLRRAELATLAGVSVEYLTRIEQGRDTHPSARVLSALATALRLGAEDAEHLHRLAAVTSGIEVGPRIHEVTRTVRPSVRELLAQLEPAPCFVVNHLGDLLVWTDGYRALMGPSGILDAAHPNVLWFTFVDPRARAVYLDWELVADEHVADLNELRWSDPAVRAFAEELTGAAGQSFSDRWQRRPLGSRRTGTRELRHPEIGTVRLAFETLQLSDPDLRLVVLLPADDDSRDALAKLQPGSGQT